MHLPSLYCSTRVRDVNVIQCIQHNLMSGRQKKNKKYHRPASASISKHQQVPSKCPASINKCPASMQQSAQQACSKVPSKHYQATTASTGISKYHQAGIKQVPSASASNHQQHQQASASQQVSKCRHQQIPAILSSASIKQVPASASIRKHQRVHMREDIIGLAVTY